MTGTSEIARQEERAAIVAWMRKQGVAWDERTQAATKKFGAKSRTTFATAIIAAGYYDHANAIERGDHLEKQG